MTEETTQSMQNLMELSHVMTFLQSMGFSTENLTTIEAIKIKNDMLEICKKNELERENLIKNPF